MFRSIDDAQLFYENQLKQKPKKEHTDPYKNWKNKYKDLTAPIAHLSSNSKEINIKEYVTFDASESIDCNGESVKKYMFDFGDRTKRIKSYSPIVKHQYKKAGKYTVSVTVTDDFGKTNNTHLIQIINNEQISQHTFNSNNLKREFREIYYMPPSIIAHVDHGKAALTEPLGHFYPCFHLLPLDLHGNIGLISPPSIIFNNGYIKTSSPKSSQIQTTTLTPKPIETNENNFIDELDMKKLSRNTNTQVWASKKDTWHRNNRCFYKKKITKLYRNKKKYKYHRW